MCSSISLTLPLFLIWCPVLDKVRRISGVHAFMVENHFLKGFSEQEAIKLYLDAKGNEMKTVRERGKAIILMRNEWYRIAKRKNINLNVRTKQIFV